MKVSIKDFDVTMEVKNKGIELSVADPTGKHLGDLFVTKKELIWCKGRINRANGKVIDWKKFMAYMEDL